MTTKNIVEGAIKDGLSALQFAAHAARAAHWCRSR